MTFNDKLLRGLKVLDLGTGHAGALATHVLALAGAEVLRIEEPGSAARLTRSQASIWQRLKQRRSLDFGLAADRQQFELLLQDTQLLVTDRTPAQAQADGVSAAELAQRHPQLALVQIGGWPHHHRLSERPVDDTLVLAEAGLLDEQAALRRAGPVYLRFALGSSPAALLAVTAGLLQLRRGGGAAYTSLLQGALVPQTMYWTRALRPTPAMAGGLPKHNPATLFECADGLWMHVMPDPNRCPEVRAGLAAMSTEERAAADAPFRQVPIRWFDNRGAVAPVFRSRPRAEWLRLLWAADVPAEAVQPMGALYLDEQVQANGYAQAVECPEFGPVWQPALPISCTTPSQRPPADTLARTSDSAGSSTTPTDTRPPRHDQVRKDLPLQGLKVLDLGSYVAGPLAPMILADLGADVIKVEAIEGDPMRRAEWPFMACQRGKRSLALNLKDPASAPLLERLVQWADVVHHNQRPPAARKLGIDADRLLAMNPAVIYAHVSAYGPDGPRCDWPGYDQLFQAASGWENLGAGVGNPPMWHRFGMMDHLAALWSVISVLLALRAREADGMGRHSDSSLLGASLFTMDAPLRHDGTLVPTAEIDELQWGESPLRRLYACADGWIAVSAPAAAPLAPGLDKLLTAAGATNLAELEVQLSQAPCAAGLALMEAAGLAAVAVRCEGRDTFLDDPEHLASRLATQLPHPLYGRLDMPGAMMDFDGFAAPCSTLPPPPLGGHSRAILAELGFSSDDIEQWIAQGLVLAA